LLYDNPCIPISFVNPYQHGSFHSHINTWVAYLQGKIMWSFVNVTSKCFWNVVSWQSSITSAF